MKQTNKNYNKVKQIRPNITIFVDESGTLPDPLNQIVIIAAVGTITPANLTQTTKTARRFSNKKQASLEVKFYRAGERTKTAFLKSLTKLDITLFVLIIEKGRQKIADTPENFALLCWLLLEDCLLFYQDSIKEIVFDRHFSQKQDQSVFNQVLTHLLKPKQAISFKHVDSQKDPRVNSADMVAGSVLWYVTGKNKIFYKLIKSKILSEKILNWKEAKRLFIKNRLNRCEHPSKRI